MARCGKSTEPAERQMGDEEKRLRVFEIYKNCAMIGVEPFAGKADEFRASKTGRRERRFKTKKLDRDGKPEVAALKSRTSGAVLIATRTKKVRRDSALLSTCHRFHKAGKTELGLF